MRNATAVRLLAATMILTGMAGAATAAPLRAKAEVACRPAAEPLFYDCTIALTDAKSNQPLTGVAVSVGADMPSMPGAHSVRPVKATAAEPPGSYRARIELEMHGDWALQLNISGGGRDRVVQVLNFQPDKVEPAKPSSSRHKH